MRYLPILQNQLYPSFNNKVIDKIAEVAEKLSIQKFSTDGGVENIIYQPPGQGLVVIVNENDSPSVEWLSVDVPMDSKTGIAMVDPSLTSVDILSAIDHKEDEVVSSFLVTHMKRRGISVGQQVERHLEMVSTEILDVMLVVRREKPERFILLDIFIGGRINE